MEELEYRMFHLVIYQLSGIQAGIQASHARDEYAEAFDQDEDFKSWRKTHKTVILLNGGDTNSLGYDHYSRKPYVGTMQMHIEKLKELGIKYSEFFEPSLNNALTGISFLLDERVFDHKKHPYPTINDIGGFIPAIHIEGDSWIRQELERLAIEKYGEKVYNTRNWIKPFRLLMT